MITGKKDADYFRVLMGTNYFESEEWQETKRMVDEKMKSESPTKGGTLKTFDDENQIEFIQAVKLFAGKEIKPVKHKIDWELVKLFNTR